MPTVGVVRVDNGNMRTNNNDRTIHLNCYGNILLYDFPELNFSHGDMAPNSRIYIIHTRNDHINERSQGNLKP